jgi:hypothetical protein
MADIAGFRFVGFAGQPAAEVRRAVCRPKVSGIGIEA